MLLSNYFLPVLKDNPVEAKVISHSLMLRSGMIRQHASGLYNWLPLGKKVLKNIEEIVRFNMDASGFIEILTPCVQSSDLWKESGRYEAYGKEMLRFKDRGGHELLFGPTAEEVVTDVIRGEIQSYRDLPKVLYQFQWKFRDEIRPRFGLMRGREFLMKDAYSFDIDMESAIRTYDQVFAAYMMTFRDLGLNAIPLMAETGEIGGDLSHEFHVVAETGESLLFYDKKFDLIGEELSENIPLLRTLYAATEDRHDPDNSPLTSGELSVRRGIEVGQIFNFADKYSKPMNLKVNDAKGNLVPLQMGSYGIGVSRLVAAIIEVYNDDKGIIWPISVAPFKVSIVNLNIKDTACNDISIKLYNQLKHERVDVLYDDTDKRPGSKFATHDLIGSPWQIIIGPKKAADNVVELKHRASGEIQELTAEIAIATVVGSLRVK
jgi:prolyl-tRNA synthetase